MRQKKIAFIETVLPIIAFENQKISNERKMEIADISNTSVSDINKLIKQFEQGKKMMQMLKNKSSKKSE